MFHVIERGRTPIIVETRHEERDFVAEMSHLPENPRGDPSFSEMLKS